MKGRFPPKPYLPRFKKQSKGFIIDMFQQECFAISIFVLVEVGFKAIWLLFVICDTSARAIPVMGYAINFLPIIHGVHIQRRS